MNTIRMSATAARNKFFTLLDQVAAGKTVIIEKDKKEIAVISPKVTKTDWEALIKATEESAGILKDYSVEEIAPLRKKGAWGDFGNWDKNIDWNKKSRKK